MEYHFIKFKIFLIFLYLTTPALLVFLLFFTATGVFAQESQFLFKWGSQGGGDGQFNRPVGIAVDQKGSVYVTESNLTIPASGNNRVQKFTADGTFMTKWGSFGSGDGQFNLPFGVAADFADNIYVADFNNHRIQKFTSNGIFVTKWGASGSENGKFLGPIDVAIDLLGFVYVADSANHRIQKFTNDGVFVAKWGSFGSGNGQFNFPRGITVDFEGNAYVSDSENQRIQKFTSDGVFITKWGMNPAGFPRGIATDQFGGIYIANRNFHRVSKFMNNGTFVTAWGFRGSGNGQFNLPLDVAVDSSNSIYVADTDNYRVQVFSILQLPMLSNLGQFKSDGAIVIPESGTTTEPTVVFKTTVLDPDNDDVKLQVELKEFGQSFNETNLIESPFISSGSEISIARYGLIPQSYHWRVRAVDSQGNASDWKEFGINGNVDFVVDLPLPTRAAMLAKGLVSQPYLWGGKGWDYDQKLFATIDAIKTGYRYYNPNIKSTDTGIGVDCSGLIMWAYNRSFDPLKPRFNNFVKNEGADAQYNYNTTVTTESELKPGDVMFFDWDINGYMDHVAMYVGESGGYDVISAADTDRGIISTSKDILKQLHGFRGFKQVISALPPSVLISAHSPVNLMVTDPDGLAITPSTIIPSDAEYLREIPRALYYSEVEQGADGKPIDQVYSYTLKTGDYIIQVLPELGASSAATYTLDFLAGDQSLILAKDALISQIPAQGYGVARSSAGEISFFVPVVVDIKPDGYPNSINIGSKGVVPVAILSGPSFDPEDVIINSVMFAGAKPLRGSFKDIDNNGDLDLILHFDTQSLKLVQDSARATLTGQLTDGRLIKGSDSVRIITNKTSFIKNILTSLWLIISKTNIF